MVPRLPSQMAFDTLVGDLERGLEAVYPHLLFRGQGVPPLAAWEGSALFETIYLQCPQLVDKAIPIPTPADFLRNVRELETTLQVLFVMLTRDYRLGRAHAHVTRWPFLLNIVQRVLQHNLRSGVSPEGPPAVLSAPESGAGQPAAQTAPESGAGQPAAHSAPESGAGQPAVPSAPESGAGQPAAGGNEEDRRAALGPHRSNSSLRGCAAPSPACQTCRRLAGISRCEATNPCSRSL